MQPRACGVVLMTISGLAGLVWLLELTALVERVSVIVQAYLRP